MTTHAFVRIIGLGLDPIDDDEVVRVVLQTITGRLTLQDVTVWLNSKVYLEG